MSTLETVKTKAPAKRKKATPKAKIVATPFSFAGRDRTPCGTVLDGARTPRWIRRTGLASRRERIDRNGLVRAAQSQCCFCSAFIKKVGRIGQLVLYRSALSHDFFPCPPPVIYSSRNTKSMNV